ncbi:MAG: alpha/beta hydrolase [Anaerolineae bacterium]|nr:alpha/beta hydrolase [Anaerolineae bacterium]MCI0609585.1 alpha/beta hydrolase [Anaerolineae bacterium]
MSTVTSKDGSKVAYEKSGGGPALVIVSAMPDRSANGQLVELLVPHFTVYNYDRRGRGGTEDEKPYAVEREFEDLEAILDEAGGSAYAYGSSGMGIFALYAAAYGLNDKYTKLAVWEPPFIIPGTRPPVPADYKLQQEKLLAEGRRGDMPELFLTVAAGLPVEFVKPLRDLPSWSAFEASAPALIHDAEVIGDFSIPETLKNVTTPTLVLDGGTTSWLSHAAQAVADALPNAQRRTLKGQPHNVAPEAIAPVLVEFFKG